MAALNYYADNWPPGTLTREKMIAYKEMDVSGWINLQKVHVSESTGAVKVRYTSELQKGELYHEFIKTLNKITDTQKGADAI